MKIMAIGTLNPLSQQQRLKYLPKEVPATLQLYLDGKMEQFWLRDGEEGVIFLMNVDSVEEADQLLKALPLRQANRPPSTTWHIDEHEIRMGTNSLPATPVI